MNFSDIAGWVGMILILGGYYCVSTERMKPRGYLYQVMALVGAAELVVNAYVQQAWPVLVLNAIWLSIAAKVIYDLAIRGDKNAKSE